MTEPAPKDMSAATGTSGADRSAASRARSDFDDERLRWSLWAVEAFDRSASTAVVISTAVTATLGGVLAITGLALHLRRRPGKRPASAMTMGPTFGGLFVQGHF